jgi:excinuclease ABC subunit A
VIRDRKGEHLAIFDEIRRQGFVRVRVDGTVYDIDEVPALAKTKKHSIDVVVDRLVIRHEESVSIEDHPDRVRLIDSLETSLRIAKGLAMAQIVDGEEMMFSEHFACPDCGISIGEIEPRNFSFNSPHGACPDCTGLGTKMEFEPSLIIPNRNLTFGEGAIHPWTKATGENSIWYFASIEALAADLGFSIQTPIRELPPEVVDKVLNGTGTRKLPVRYPGKNGRVRVYDVPFEGVIPNLRRRYESTQSDWVKEDIERYMAARPCPTCNGARLKLT